MGQKATNRVAQDKTLALRQLSILQQRAMGKGVQQIATTMGVHRATIYRTMKPVLAADSEWRDTERDNIKSFLGLTNANIATNLERGNLEAAKLVLKVLGFLTDELKVSGSIEQKLSDQEITDKAKQVILEVIQEAKTKGSAEDVSSETKVLQSGEVKQIEGSRATDSVPGHQTKEIEETKGATDD